MISIKDVEHVAKLARLSLSAEEKELYADQLAKILGYFEELKQLDTKGIEPLSHPLPLDLPLRKDEPIKPPGSSILLENAPDKENAFIRVPKIGE